MNTNVFLLYMASACTLLALTQAFTSEEVKCQVCKATVQEMEEAVSKEDPNKIAEVSGFRLDASGNSISKTVKLVKSEMYLTELMEKICGKMDDYVKATYKKNGKFTLLKMIINDKMNPDSSLVDFVQDGDLNKSLEHFCLEILDDQEEVFLAAFQAQTISPDLDIEICAVKSHYCPHTPMQEEYDFDSKDEL